MLKTAALAFGIVFIAIGILGFIPAFAPDNHLFGVFEVGGLHNWVHILSGAAALLMAGSNQTARLYFRVFGVIYGLVTVLGVFYGDAQLLGVMNHNVADILLHAVITAAALYLGYGTSGEETPTATPVA